jgi:hypothetical protein
LGEAIKQLSERASHYLQCSFLSGSAVTCTSDPDLTSIQKEVNGQCSKTAPGSGVAGKTMFVNCNLGGRACNGAVQSAPDATMYCTDTPLLPNNQSTSTCSDPTTTTAELACQNSWKWPTMPSNAVNDQDWVHWVFVNAPIQEDNEQDCQIQAENIAFIGLGIASGSLGSFTSTRPTCPRLSSRTGAASRRD